MLRRIALSMILLSLPFVAVAQDRAQSLADIKSELTILMAEFNALKSELVISGAAATGAAGGDALQRLDAIEAELVRLTAKSEEIELKVNRVISDGTNRIGDLEFRLCEQTEGCDTAALPEIAVLGGGGTAPAADPVTVEPTAGDTGDAGTGDAGTGSGGTGDAGTGGAELAISEQADFDRAKEVLAQGDFQRAAELFATFAQSYPGSPLTQDAQFERGEALAQAGDIAGSARSYLEAFSGQPDGPLAPDALMKLGLALGALGQTNEACMTLTEVGSRFAGTAAATEAASAMPGLQCP